MTTTAGISLHVDPTQISHHYRPADEHSDGYGTLDLGKPGYDAYMYVFFKTTAAIDIAIAELVALKQEMAPPVITACETCGAAEDLEETVWRSMADGSEHSRYFCNDRRACNNRRFPEMAALLEREPVQDRHADAGCYDITGRTA
jgi:hypothetical protein